jgi:hypothetical protein
MMTERQTIFLEQLHPKLAAIAKLNPTDFVQRERLGEALSFEFAEPIIRQSIALFTGLENFDWARVPAPMIEATNSQAQQALEFLEKFRTFNPGVGNADTERRTLGDQLESHYHGWYVHTGQLLRHFVDEPKNVELDTLVKATNEALARQGQVLGAVVDDSMAAKRRLDEEIAAIRDEATRDAKEKLVEVENTLASVRKLASEAGVSQHAAVFDEEAKKLERISLRWLIASGVFAIFIGAMAFNLIGLSNWDQVSIGAASNSYIALRPVIEKTTISLLLFFGLFLSIRNYSANRHNEIVNRHRMNALRSFETFARSASDDATKNVVLIQATQAIFSPQATGYVKNDGENSPSSPIIELIRTAGSGDKK